MNGFAADLLTALQAHTSRIDAWVILPNHYHVVVLTEAFPALLHELGLLHGRCSFRWNREDRARGRKVWFNLLERAITGDAHHVRAIHYIHHNPVKHGLVKKWDQWQWSSAAEYLRAIGRTEAERRWREYPLLDFGRGWDD